MSDTWDASEAVSLGQFESQVNYLARRGWRSVTFSEALASSSRRVVAITFDDALASVKSRAFPILQSVGFNATVFAPTHHVTSGEPCAWPGLHHWGSTEHASELAPVTWSDLADLRDAGWEIGSHTCTHPRLTSLDDHALARELCGSREAAVEPLGAPFDTIAYPYGDVDDRVARLAAAAGYSAGAALASSLRDHGRLQVPRIGIYRRDRALRFRLKLNRTVRRLRASAVWGG